MELAKHYAHEIVVAMYGNHDNPIGYAVECMDCYEVVIDDEAYAQLERKSK